MIISTKLAALSLTNHIDKILILINQFRKCNRCMNINTLTIVQSLNINLEDFVKNKRTKH